MESNQVQVTFKLHYLPPAILDALREDSSLLVGVFGSIPELGSLNPCRMLVADKTEDDVWTVTVRLPVGTNFGWYWIVTQSDGFILFSDIVSQRQTTLSSFSGILETLWGSDEARFVAQTSGVMMRVHYRCQEDQVLAIVGSGPHLGSWDPKNAILAKDSHPNSSIWTAEALLDNTVQDYEWKWVVLEKETGDVARWEERENRHLEPQADSLVTLTETKWGNDFRCEHRGTLEEVNSYLDSQDSTNAQINWLNNANCIMLPYEVSDVDLARIAAAERAAEPVWETAIRQLPVVLKFLYDWSRF